MTGVAGRGKSSLIRDVFAKENNVSDSLFTFNGKGACPYCKGKGYITTELIFMEPITTLCEECNRDRYSKEALQYRYKSKNIVEVLNMSVEDASDFFKDNKKIMDYLNALMEVGLSYTSCFRYRKNNGNIRIYCRKEYGNTITAEYL